ncbi:TonB family protein [Phaeobacter sp. B1627]|uniref:TonB family protein n=1 Tax=Phaeobacter sp. B1627 TaxID=2583809 RepID=UPI00111862EA|nr:TonB family protein [Phaeobacter sp. B1627]TNJ44438.1 TonB family protein [Phaeobacter sp. B1627]
MIPRSPVIGAVSLLLALAAHGAMLVDTDLNAVEIEGGGNVAPAALGSSFADLARGTATPVEAEVTSEAESETTPVPPVPVPPVEESPVTQRTDVVAAQSPLPPTATRSEVSSETPVAVPTVSATVAALPEATAPATEVAAVAVAVAPNAPVPTTPLPATPVTPTPVTPEVAATPAPESVPEPVEPTPPEEVAPVQEPSELAPETSMRPATRPAPEPKREKPPEKVEKPRKPAEKPAVAPRGNSTVSARAGTETGDEDQSAAQAASQKPGQSTGAGNAAASNYPGKVLRQISRLRKPKTSVKGTAHVAFAIGPGGALTSVSIARSSGSAELDGLAMQQIRKAAPFPPPPAGARRQYTIGIKGR